MLTLASRRARAGYLLRRPLKRARACDRLTCRLSLGALYRAWTCDRLTRLLSLGALYHARAAYVAGAGASVWLCCAMMMAGRAVMRLRCMVRPLMRLVLGAMPGIVTMMMFGRLGGMMTTMGVMIVMVVVVIPGRRAPVRHIAAGNQQVDGEDGRARCGITIYWAPIIVTINGEAVGIVAGRSPGHTRGNVGVVAICAVSHGGVAIRVNLTGSKQQRCCSENGELAILVFHNSAVNTGFYYLFSSK